MIKVKFRKEKIENARYEGSVEIRWWFDAGTKHLPAVYAIKEGYSWEIYDAEGNSFTRYLDYYSSLRTKADAKAFIEDYDAAEDARIADEKAEEAKRITEYEAMKARENALMEAFLLPCEGKKVEVGDMIEVKMDNASKSCNLGETLDNVLVEGSYHEIPAKVVKILDVTPERYEEFVRHSLRTDGNFEFLKEEDGGIVGGTSNDDPYFEGMTHAELCRPENMNRYRLEMYGLIHVVKCAGRRNIYINTEGYNYARYLGVDSETNLNYDDTVQVAA